MTPPLRRLIIPGILCAACFLLIAVFTAIAQTNGSGGLLTVSFIDVGQGDAILLHDTAGCNILIDGGASSTGAAVVAYLRATDVRNLDAMFVSHADSDHYGGLTTVLQTSDISVTQVYYNGYGDSTSHTWNAFEAAVVAKGLTFTVAAYPDTYTWCWTTAQVLNPSPLITYTNDNDASIVLLAQHGRTRYLFTGDMTSNIDAAVIARTSALPIDTLKVSHHGSQYATSSAFLALAMPKTAVISVGPNTYGHPTTETLTRLGAIGAQVLRTDMSGTIVLHDISQLTSFAYLPVIAAPTVPTPNLRIVALSGLSDPEVVTITNAGLVSMAMTGWKLVSVVGPQTYLFPADLMLAPGATVRIESYTLASNNPPGTLLWSTNPIWNNDGDKAELRNPLDSVVSNACYGNACP
jgi:competence protein ComEC